MGKLTGRSALLAARIAGLLALGGVLVGCAGPKYMEVASISAIQPTNGGQGLDVYAKRRASGEQAPAFAGDQVVEIRSFAGTEDGGFGSNDKEMSGANCKVSANGFKANIKTPAKLRLPIYGHASSDLAISCQKQGYQPKSVVVSAFNETKNRRLNAGGSAGVVGLLVMTAVNSATSNAGHDYAYPMARVVMTPLGGGKK